MPCALSVEHHTKALDFVATDTMMEHARRLGLTVGKTLVADSTEEMTLLFDLALYSAKQGRTRALDRYARTARLAPGSDAALVLDAMRQGRFSIWRVERQHETAGLIITDMMRETEAWLVDENLEASAPQGMLMAGRVFEPEGFAVTCGAIVPATLALLQELSSNALRWQQDRPAQDPRFATALYRAAMNSGTMSRVRYE